MDVKAVADGDTVTVYVSTSDPRESSSVPKDVQLAAVQRSEARAKKNYTKADALHKKITDAGYRFNKLANFPINDGASHYLLKLNVSNSIALITPAGS